MRVRSARTLGVTAGLALTVGLGACGGAAGPAAPGGPGAAVAAKPLSDGTLEFLSRPDSHYAVATEDPAVTRPKVPVARAVDVANQQIMGAGGPAQMSLVRYTNKVATAKSARGGKPALAVSDRLAWAMVYDGFQEPVAAASPTYDVKNGKVVPVQPPSVPAATTSLVMFVDAATGDYIEALTLDH